MQAITVKDDNGKTYFLGLNKKAYIVPGYAIPEVDEEWEVIIVEDQGDNYLVKPIYKHEKKTYYKLVHHASKDYIYKIVAIGKRILSQKHIKTIYTPQDCIHLDAPLDIRKRALQNRIRWVEKKALMMAIIPWQKKPGLTTIKSRGLSGVIYAKQAGAWAQNYFFGHGYILRGPCFHSFRDEEIKIKSLLSGGESLQILIDTSKSEGFLTDFFKRARIQCGGVVTPFPQGLQTKEEVLEYFRRSKAC